MGGKTGQLTIVAKRSRVSSLLSKNRPQPSNSSAKFSTFVPAKSSRQTLNMCKMRWGGTTRNLVKFDKYKMFWANVSLHDLPGGNRTDKKILTLSRTSENSLTTFFFFCK